MKLKDSFHPYAVATIICWSLAYVFTRMALNYFSAIRLSPICGRLHSFGRRSIFNENEAAQEKGPLMVCPFGGGRLFSVHNHIQQGL
jgi:hypothetical protein